MKIKLRQLRPNPFRNVTRYPISRAKVELLKASIRTTGFWDNLVVRCAPNQSKRSVSEYEYEIAYGHHRLEALKELVNERLIDEDFEFELSVRKLDDSAMVRIMASENMREYAATCDVIDETVEATRAFIAQETKCALKDISAPDISHFLGGGWNEDQVWTSLQRLKLFDIGVLDRQHLKGVTAAAGRGVQREVAKVIKSNVRADLEEASDEELTEDRRKQIFTRAQTLGRKVGEAMVEHIRDGGTAKKLKEVSLDAQLETVVEEAPKRGNTLSTIDAAARAVHARDFQRKIEMLMKYKAHMSIEARHELAGTLKEIKGWIDLMLEDFGA